MHKRFKLDIIETSAYERCIALKSNFKKLQSESKKWIYILILVGILISNYQNCSRNIKVDQSSDDPTATVYNWSLETSMRNQPLPANQEVYYVDYAPWTPSNSLGMYSSNCNLVKNKTCLQGPGYFTNPLVDSPITIKQMKITIDSATLMNKGLEVIEAKWLFDFEADQISVIVHPQSVVHSMVEMVDGSIIAQLGVTDMKHPIQYALTYPDRKESCLAPLDILKLSQLNFEEPDLERFPCLGLAFSALSSGGTMPAVLNAANETAVQAFLDGRIRLSEIAQINAGVMNAHQTEPVSDLNTVLRVDAWARAAAIRLLSVKASSAAPRN